MIGDNHSLDSLRKTQNSLAMPSIGIDETKIILSKKKLRPECLKYLDSHI